MFMHVRVTVSYAAALGVVAMSLLFVSSPTIAQIFPCARSLAYLSETYDKDQKTQDAFERIYAGLKDLPVGYSYNHSRVNPWKDAGSGHGLYRKMIEMFKTWCTDLPEISGTSDNGLDGILYFAWLYYQNEAGQNFVQGRDPANPDLPLETGPTFLSMFNDEYRAYMDSEASAEIVPEWVRDPRIEINDYTKTKASDYRSWNEFFTRNLKSTPEGTYPSRPVTMENRDYVIVSPTDCIMNPLVQVLKQKDDTYRRNYIDNPLQLDTVLDVKNIPISVQDMLGDAPQEIKEKFVGGSGLSCVLMPNTYHHFHSPVDGKIVHAEIVKTGSPGTPGTFGYPDFPNWVPLSGNVGRPGTDFSQFQAFQRGVIIIEVRYANLPGKTPETLTGYVASIPVGLDTVGSVVLNTCDSKTTDHVNCFDVGGQAKKGQTKFGNFFYGGSLNILLFSEGMVSPAVQTRMGNQIGILNVGQAPKSPWSMD